MERYPNNLQVSSEDFQSLNINATINLIEQKECNLIWQTLSSKARKAIEQGNMKEGKILWLIADACSMVLNPASINEPFKPMAVFSGKRSTIPEDFKEDDILLFSEMVYEIDNIWIRSRLADIVWLIKYPREHKFALLAIDTYRNIPLKTEIWDRGGRECWERAFRLIRMLGKGAGKRIEELEMSIFCAFELSTYDDGYFALWLAQFMEETRLVYSKTIDIAEKLEKLGRQFDKDIYKRRDYFEDAAKWYKRTDDKLKYVEMIILVAESWVDEAEERMTSKQPSHMIAASFLEHAIQKYRSIPKDQRSAYDVDEHLADLHDKMNKAGKKSLDEMCEISSPSIDITNLVDNARDAVRGKNPMEALISFANIFNGFQLAKLRESSEKMFRENPLQAMVSANYISRDGRIIAKRPGLNLGTLDSDENEAALWAEMVNEYKMQLGLIVKGNIWPALEILHLEHRIREVDFFWIANHSPIVPDHRERLLGKGLYAGYDKDFTTSIHLLIPQIEHMVRWHLKLRNVKTTILDSQGIENEVGLSTLIDLPEVNKIFGDNIAFEFKALFCDAHGPNLRNELAHGLLDYYNCESEYSVYAWWLCLKIVLNTYWNTLNHKPKETVGASEKFCRRRSAKSE